MTHSTTIPPVIIRDLSRRSDVAGLVQISGHLVASCGTGWLVLSAGDSAWLPIAIALHGVVLVFLFSGEHEAIHFTAFRSRKLNWIVAWLGGLVLVLPPAWFRCFHLAQNIFTTRLAVDSCCDLNEDWKLPINKKQNPPPRNNHEIQNWRKF